MPMRMKIKLSLSSLILSAALRFHTAIAGWDDVEAVLLKMESVAREVRDELEKSYAARCDPATLEQCTKNNYHDCASRFPDPHCGLKFDDKDPHSFCQCGLQWDHSITTVTMPKALGSNATLIDEEVTETICYTRLVEKLMIESINSDYWTEYSIQPGAVFLGSNDGIFRTVPARHSEQCGQFDPRVRPWYTTASSVPKDVVIVIDVSLSMSRQNILYAQQAASTIISTLTKFDRFTVVAFSSEADVLLGGGNLLNATNENKEKSIAKIEALKSTNDTSNLLNSFNATFDILSKSALSGHSSQCTAAIVLFTDGRVNDSQSEEDTSKVIRFVEEQTEKLSTDYGKKSFLFAYSMGEDSNTSFTKSLACGSGGIWNLFGNDDSDDIVSVLSSYFKLFTIGIANEQQSDFVAWIEPYFWIFHQRWVISVSLPVFDRNVIPFKLLGVAAVGMYMDSLERLHGEVNTSAMYLEWMAKRSSFDGCPEINQTACQLDSLRFIGGGENATCGQCNSTSDVASLESAVCPSNTLLPIDLWHNIEHHEMEYDERGCCEHIRSFSADSCSSLETTTTNGGGNPNWGVINWAMFFAAASIVVYSV